MIKAAKDYLNSFFNGQTQYVVPFFQRAYVWDKDNWEILWDNIKLIFEEFILNNKAEHFIGTLIVKQQMAEQIGESKYDLIDGQQRLTTISLLLKALADTSTGELPKLPIQINNLLEFEDARENRYLRISHNKNDKPYFDAIIYNKEFDDLINSEHLLIQCYEYYKEKVGTLTDDERDLLQKVILHRVPIISMILAAEDDEQVIFDTINSLGVKLTTAELLKNFIFKEAELQQLYEEHWEKIFEADEEQIAFWNKEKTAGRIIRTNVEVLLYCYLIIKTKSEIRIEQLFKEYKKWLKDKSTEEKKDFLKELKNYVKYYFNLPEGEQLNEIAFVETEKRFFHFIENLSITTIYPLVLYIYKNVENEEERERIISYFESYLVRRNLCRLTTKNYNNLFISIIKKLDLLNESITLQGVKSIIGEFGEDTNRMPSNDEVFTAFHTSVLTNQNAREILFLISLYYQNNGLVDIKKLSAESYSVEHIMPKKWEENWNGDINTEDQKRIRNQKLKTLGNLTLITKRLNSSLKNQSWDSKKGTLNQYSSLKITKDYLECENWDEAEITRRANDLSDAALVIWTI